MSFETLGKNTTAVTVDFHTESFIDARFRYVTYEGLFQLAARQFLPTQKRVVNKL